MGEMADIAIASALAGKCVLPTWNEAEAAEARRELEEQSEAEYQREQEVETEAKIQRMMVATDSIRRCLHEGDRWIDAAGKVHLIETIKPRYARNILRWLESRAPLLHDMECLRMAGTPAPTAEQASYDFDDAFNHLNEMDPKDWLEESPLVQNLRQISNRQKVRRGSR